MSTSAKETAVSETAVSNVRGYYTIKLELESGWLDGRVEHVDRVEGKAVLNVETQRSLKLPAAEVWDYPWTRSVSVPILRVNLGRVSGMTTSFVSPAAGRLS